MSPSYGLCLLQIPCWCEFSFSQVSLWGLPKKMSLTQREPLRKDKIRGQNSSLSVVKNGWRVTHPACIYPCNLLETSFTPHGFFTTAGSYFVLYFVFLMSSGRLVGLFTGSPKGSRGNKRTWLPGMAASQTYKGRHKEAFWSASFSNYDLFLSRFFALPAKQQSSASQSGQKHTKSDR